MNAIKHVVLDFDGTCTQIPVIYAAFLKQYKNELNARLPPNQQISDDEWSNAQDQVRQHSPAAGWSIGTTPSAPAAADPYILSGEAAKYIFKAKKITTPIPVEAFANSSAAHPAPWREETLEIIKLLLKQNVSVHFVSNSGTQMIKQRMQDLWGGTNLPPGIDFHGSASKYNISEPDWVEVVEWPAWLKDLYSAVPAAEISVNIGRPIYLRRGSLASIIAAVFKNDPDMLATTIFCGDIWELDLALPAALGANIHLIERASPFDTYDYERNLTMLNKHKGKISRDLRGLKAWL